MTKANSTLSEKFRDIDSSQCTGTLFFHYMFVLHVNCQDTRRLTLALGPVSFSVYFIVLFIYYFPLTNDMVNVPYSRILQTILSTSL